MADYIITVPGLLHHSDRVQWKTLQRFGRAASVGVWCACLAAMEGKAEVEELMLWNGLGSAAEIATSFVGPGGSVSSGTFDQGVFGQAILAQHTDDLPVVFSMEGFSTKRGRIEFYARIIQPPVAVSSAGIFFAYSSVWDYAIGIGANDGQGGGGLFGRVGIGEDGAEAATGPTGGYTFEGVLGAGLAEDWHHYQLVWNSEGMPSVGIGNRKVAVFLDGNLNSTYWTPSEVFPNSEVFPPGAKLQLLLNFESQGSVMLDELKVYGYSEMGSNPQQPVPPTQVVSDDTVVFEVIYDPGPDPSNPELVYFPSCPIWEGTPELVDSFQYELQPGSPGFWDVQIPSPEDQPWLDDYTVEVWTDYGEGFIFDGWASGGELFPFDGPELSGDAVGADGMMDNVRRFELRGIRGRPGDPMFVPGFSFMHEGPVKLTIHAKSTPPPPRRIGPGKPGADPRRRGR